MVGLEDLVNLCTFHINFSVTHKVLLKKKKNYLNLEIKFSIEGFLTGTCTYIPHGRKLTEDSVWWPPLLGNTWVIFGVIFRLYCSVFWLIWWLVGRITCIPHYISLPTFRLENQFSFNNHMWVTIHEFTKMGKTVLSSTC